MLQALEDRDLDLVAGGGGHGINIGNGNWYSFNTGGVYVKGDVEIWAAGSTVQVGSNGGLNILINN